MNWTGGSLTSSRNAKVSGIATQKKHFAKARKQIYLGHQTPVDLDFSIFEPNAKITKRPSAQQTSQDIWPLERDGGGTQNFPQNTRNGGNVAPAKSECPNPHACDDDSTTLPCSATRNQCVDEEGMSSLTRDEFEAKKKELLAMRDWCGLESTRPVKMTFEDPADRDMIGRRRRISIDPSSIERRSHHHRLRRLCGRRPRNSHHGAYISSDGFYEPE